MVNFCLNPADILVKVSNGHDPFSVIERWALGSPFDHVFLYLGAVRIITDPRQHQTLRFPMLFESNGRGVVIQALSNRYGQEVVVMRLKEGYRQGIPKVLKEAVKLASDESARYDYMCIVQFILPRLICEKLGIAMPLKWHRNLLHVCSEAIFEVFYRAKYKILPLNRVPLPGDFVTDSPILEQVWAVTLSEVVVHSSISSPVA
ncbi:hypothetical protein ES703_69340 [subsurface metagenome]